MTRWKNVPLKYCQRARNTKLFTAANDAAAGIRTIELADVVVNVASKTEVLVMHAGGAFVNHTTRLADPPAGGHVGTTAAAVSGWVTGVANVVDVTVVDVEVEVELEVELVPGLVVVVEPAFFLPDPLTRNTIRTINAADDTESEAAPSSTAGACGPSR